MRIKWKGFLNRERILNWNMGVKIFFIYFVYFSLCFISLGLSVCLQYSFSLSLSLSLSNSSLPLLSGPPRVLILDRVPSTGQIELFNFFLGIIISCLKQYSHVKIIYITLEYLINRISNVKLQYLKPFNCVQTNDWYQK